NAGEDRGVDDLLVLCLHHDDAATRAAQRLVRGGGHEVGMRNRVGVDAAGDQACVVGNIYHEKSPYITGDAGHALEVDAQGIGGCAAHDQLGLVLASQLLERVVVQFFLVVQAVRDKVVKLAGSVDRRTVCKVAPFSETHSQYGVAGLQNSHVDSLVGLRARIGLHVGGFRTKNLLEAVNRQLF